MSTIAMGSVVSCSNTGQFKLILHWVQRLSTEKVIWWSYWVPMFVKKTVFFNNLFLKFFRDFYNKSTNSCIIISHKIMYNLNVTTIFSTMFWKYRLKGYHFITWIPSCCKIILVIIHTSISGDKCIYSMIFIDPKEAGQNTFTAVLLSLWLAPFWRSDSTHHAWGKRQGESRCLFYLQTRPALFQSCFWSCHLHRSTTADWGHHGVHKCSRSWFPGSHPTPIWAQRFHTSKFFWFY